MGQITRQINSIRLEEKKSVRKVFKEHPHLVELQKEEMFDDWEKEYLLEDDPREYVLYRPRNEDSRDKKPWKKNDR